MPQLSALRGSRVTLQSAATTGSGTVIAVPTSARNHKLFIRGSAGIASGAVQPETSSDPAYTGTWGQIGGGPVSLVASTELIVEFSGVYQFIRCRVSTTVVGGTVTVEYLGF